MPCLPCGGKDVMADILFQDCPVCLFSIFWNCFNLSRPATLCTKKMTPCMSGPGSAVQCLPVAANVMNTQVFASWCEASLIKTIATSCGGLMDNRSMSLTSVLCSRLYPKISNARSKPSIMKEPMFLSCARIRCTWQRTPIKWFLECIKRLFHTTSTQKSGPLRTCCGEYFSHNFFTKREQKYEWLGDTNPLLSQKLGSEAHKH